MMMLSRYLWTQQLLLTARNSIVYISDNFFLYVLKIAAIYISYQCLKYICIRDYSQDLYFASDCGNLDVVLWSLKLTKIINVRKKDDLTPLMIAAMNGHAAVVAVLLSAGVYVNCYDIYGKTALYHAAQAGNLHIVKLLLAKGADANSKCNDGRTPVMIACHNCHIRVVEALIAHRADIRWKALNGDNSLLATITEGIDSDTVGGCSDSSSVAGEKRLRIVELLVRCGSNLESKTVDGWTALIKACYLGYASIAICLLAANADVNAVAPSTGFTPLIAACQYGSYVIAHSLLKKHARIDACLNDGSTALVAACYGGFFDVVQLLVANHASISASSTGTCAALLVSITEKHEDIAILLLDDGATKAANSKGSDGSDPLYAAVTNGCYRIVCKLLALGANANYCSTDGWSCLMYACQKGYKDIAHQLLHYGADVNIQRGCWNALSIAVCSGDCDFVSLLLMHNAWIKKYNKNSNYTDEDEDNSSPIIAACDIGSVELLQLLLSHGASPDVDHRYGRTPLSICIKSANVPCIDALTAAGVSVGIVDRLRIWMIRVRGPHYGHRKNRSNATSKYKSE